MQQSSAIREVEETLLIRTAYFTAYCLLPTAYCLLPTAYCLLPTAYCLLPTAYCLLPTAYSNCLLPPAVCLLFPAARRPHLSSIFGVCRDFPGDRRRNHAQCPDQVGRTEYKIQVVRQSSALLGSTEMVRGSSPYYLLKANLLAPRRRGARQSLPRACAGIPSRSEIVAQTAWCATRRALGRREPTRLNHPLFPVEFSDRP